MTDNPPQSGARHLHRSLGLSQATAMNMLNMIGAGPFFTIPLILAAMVGPQAMLGWILGAVLAVCDGMVWAELSSAIPLSGGTFEYLKIAYLGTPLARLLPFLFIWQFILSGPLEIASGTIGFSQYLTYLLPMSPAVQKWLAAAVTALAIALLYRKIETVGRMMMLLWAGTILTIAVVVAWGLPHLGSGLAFDFPPRAFSLSRDFFFGLGSATLMSTYNFLGYYCVCFVGDEVRAPVTTIPRSILVAVVAVAVIYLTMNVCITSVVPWREAMHSKFIVSEYIERLSGPWGGRIITGLICWTSFACVFVLLLSYSRIPYAAARDGFFFPVFARLHPRGDFPHVSLLLLGAITMGASFFDLDAVIKALLSTRILVQFVAQIGALALLRRKTPHAFAFRMFWYPLPSLIALAGWIFIFATSGGVYILGGLATLAAGVAAFGLWSRWSASARLRQ